MPQYLAKSSILTLTAAILITGAPSYSTDAPTKDQPPQAKSDVSKKSVPELMAALRKRVETLKYKWDVSFLVEDGWQVGGHSIDGMPLIYWTCGDQKKNDNTALVLSAVHGDEVTPVYFGFRLVEWVKARPEICKDRFVVIAPLVNPDGFLRYTRGTRTNYNKVDVNRNFDTPDWATNARKMWKEKYSSMRRYFPGDTAASEPETQFQQWLIEEFKPEKILSVHAPLNILDYDGPQGGGPQSFLQSYVESCEILKNAIKKATPELRLYAYGQFPGSLGNFAGKQRGIPTITVELPTTDHTLAGHYFSLLEKGTRVFFEHQIKDSPMRSAKN